MRLKHNKTLITGKPGVGKTTIIQRVIDRIGSDNIAGFYTSEIRSKGSRVGFELCGLHGHRRMLAHKDIKGPHRVGKYGVDTQGFEEFLGELDLRNPDIDLIVIDEIGKMELFSKRFREMVRDVMDSDKQFLATIALKGGGFISEIKGRSDTQLLEVTAQNRDHLPETIIETS
jgi:nucleoside-triphosphatase